MAQSLVQNKRDGVGQIERPQAVSHGYAQRRFGIVEHDMFGQAFRFLAEHQIIPVGKLDVAIALVRLFGQIEIPPAASFFKKFVDILDRKSVV